MKVANMKKAQEVKTTTTKLVYLILSPLYFKSGIKELSFFTYFGI